MRKKILATLLAAAMLLAMAVPAAAAGAEFVVTAPPGPIQAGETFEVTVDLNNNPGFLSLTLTLYFSTKDVTCDRITRGDVLDGLLTVTNPKARDGAIIVAAGSDASVYSGRVATLRFTAVRDLSGKVFRAELTEMIGTDHRELSVPVTGPAPFAGSSSPSDPTPDEPDPVDPTPTPPQPLPPSGGETGDETPAFTDIAGHWAEASIRRSAQLGIFKGYPGGAFGPEDNVTRGQFVTVLYRMAGSPKVTATAPFTDIADQSEEFRTAIHWAYSIGAVNGKTPTTFDPRGSVTRQEALKILFFYAGGQSGMEMLVAPIYESSFADSAEIGAWAKSAMYWGVYHEIISGQGTDRLRPTAPATRAELADILVNYLDKFQ